MWQMEEIITLKILLLVYHKKKKNRGQNKWKKYFYQMRIQNNWNELNILTKYNYINVNKNFVVVAKDNKKALVNKTPGNVHLLT